MNLVFTAIKESLSSKCFSFWRGIQYNVVWISLKVVVFGYFPLFVYYVPTVILNKSISAMLRTDSKAVINKL